MAQIPIKVSQDVTDANHILNFTIYLVMAKKSNRKHIGICTMRCNFPLLLTHLSFFSVMNVFHGSIINMERLFEGGTLSAVLLPHTDSHLECIRVSDKTIKTQFISFISSSFVVHGFAWTQCAFELFSTRVRLDQAPHRDTDLNLHSDLSALTDTSCVCFEEHTKPSEATFAYLTSPTSMIGYHHYGWQVEREDMPPLPPWEKGQFSSLGHHVS